LKKTIVTKPSGRFYWRFLVTIIRDCIGDPWFLCTTHQRGIPLWCVVQRNHGSPILSSMIVTSQSSVESPKDYKACSYWFRSFRISC
jgi:hypothetical protein